MARLRYNGLATGASGSLVPLALGASLTSSATSVTFNAALTYSGGTAVPTITGSDYIPLTIKDATGNVSEIVYLTAYTTAGTTGTITRGREGTTGVAHSSGDKVVHGPTTLDIAAESGTFIGAHVTRLANAVVANEAPLTFDTENADTHGYWSSGNPTKFTIPAGFGGWYMVGANVTTLGTSYSGPSNDNVQIAVLKNWDGTSTQLGYYCAYERFNNENGASAHGNSLVQPVYLNDGDVLQVVLIGPTVDGLLVESNPSDGVPSGYPTDTGPGTLSPHFFLVKLGPGAPGPTGATGAPGVVQSVVAGTGVTVNSTDPANPVVSTSSTTAFSGASLTKSATQSVSASTETAITWNGEAFDTDNYHDNSTNPSRITVATTGKYLVGGSVTLLSMAAGKAVILFLKKNGSALGGAGYARVQNGSVAGDVGLSISGLVPLTAGDYVEICSYHNDTTARNADVSANGGSFWIEKRG